VNSQYSTPPALSTTHRRQLEESGISPDVAAERGYRTVRSRAELSDFKGYQQRAPALRVPTFSPDGETTGSQIRPDKPRKDKKNKPIKYETAAGAGVVLDVHPRNLQAVRDPSTDLWIGEGVKKGDSAVSRGQVVVSLIGVWGWRKDGKPLPCWEHVALKDRKVFVCFDSDVMLKPEVQLALEHLVAMLEERGADVRVVYLPGGEGEEKVGMDDFFAAGGTVAELKALARKFEPEDLGRIRLSRDEKLRAAVVELERRFWTSEWKGMGGHSDRDVYLKLIEAARRHGKPVKDGIRVTISHGTLALQAKVSTRTLWKAINRLEEWGLAYRDNEDRKPDKAGAFLLRASVRRYGKKQGSQGKDTQRLQESDPGDLHLRAPRLRWSSPKWKPSARTIRKARLERRQAPLPEPRPAIKRLGKGRGAFLDALDVAGGTAPIQEIADALHHKRARDLRRRTLPMLEEAGIVSVEGDVVSLAPDWLERLEQVREVGGEIEVDETARRRLAIKRRAYHNRHKHPADRAPTHEEIAALEDARNAWRMRLALEALRAPGSGPAKNLELFMNSELHNVEYLVRSILRFHKAPTEMLERWRAPVLEAAAVVVSEISPTDEVIPPEPAPRHRLDCECEACLYPEPRYARPYRGRSSA
jgi:hypothetical protein